MDRWHPFSSSHFLKVRKELRLYGFFQIFSEPSGKGTPEIEFSRALMTSPSGGTAFADWLISTAEITEIIQYCRDNTSIRLLAFD